uniref:Uncharacterized protein n=1 Tax=Romanomermis culicivorax TaxID=13658 RepID=A0A915J581_ROMCU
MENYFLLIITAYMNRNRNKTFGDGVFKFYVSGPVQRHFGMRGKTWAQLCEQADQVEPVPVQFLIE